MTKKNYNKYNVSPEEVGKAWNSSESADEAAQKLGMPKPILLARVSSYRQKGIKLKKMRRKNSRRIEPDKINREICSLTSNNTQVMEMPGSANSPLPLPTALLANEEHDQIFLAGLKWHRQAVGSLGKERTRQILDTLKVLTGE